MEKLDSSGINSAAVSNLSEAKLIKKLNEAVKERSRFDFIKEVFKSKGTVDVKNLPEKKITLLNQNTALIYILLDEVENRLECGKSFKNHRFIINKLRKKAFLVDKALKINIKDKKTSTVASQPGSITKKIDSISKAINECKDYPNLKKLDSEMSDAIISFLKEKKGLNTQQIIYIILKIDQQLKNNPNKHYFGELISVEEEYISYVAEELQRLNPVSLMNINNPDSIINNPDTLKEQLSFKNFIIHKKNIEAKEKEEKKQENVQRDQDDPRVELRPSLKEVRERVLKLSKEEQLNLLLIEQAQTNLKNKTVDNLSNPAFIAALLNGIIDVNYYNSINNLSDEKLALISPLFDKNTLTLIMEKLPFEKRIKVAAYMSKEQIDQFSKKELSKIFNNDQSNATQSQPAIHLVHIEDVSSRLIPYLSPWVIGLGTHFTPLNGTIIKTEATYPENIKELVNVSMLTRYMAHNRLLVSICELDKLEQGLLAKAHLLSAVKSGQGPKAQEMIELYYRDPEELCNKLTVDYPEQKEKIKQTFKQLKHLREWITAGMPAPNPSISEETHLENLPFYPEFLQQEQQKSIYSSLADHINNRAIS